MRQARSLPSLTTSIEIAVCSPRSEAPIRTIAPSLYITYILFYFIFAAGDFSSVHVARTKARTKVIREQRAKLLKIPLPCASFSVFLFSLIESSL